MNEIYEYDEEDISDIMDIVELQIENEKLNKEIERLNNIIKEVREYIEIQQKIFKDYDIAMENQLKNVLEILNKGE